MIKRAAVKPLLKKRNQDASILNNYRLVSNLLFLAKIIEKVVLNQLSDFLGRVGILDKFQSGFRPHHRTETTLVKVLNDIRLNTDSGRVSMLVLLDLSATFDTVDHGILMHRLGNWVGLLETVLKWFRTYLEHKRYLVKIGTYEPEEQAMTSGVPQGSILGPLQLNQDKTEIILFGSKENRTTIAEYLETRALNES